MIGEGRVTVDGVVAETGAQADASQTICVDGKPICGAEQHVYFLLNKPKGYISTAKDDRGRKTVLDLLPEVKARIYPAGRLDNALYLRRFVIPTFFKMLGIFQGIDAHFQFQ